MRPTMKDLAKEAGVSLATLDRVLNDRPGVRVKTISRVNEAIDKLGFVRNMQAANLARNKSHNYQFILPCSGGEFHNKLIARIDEANNTFASEMVSVHVKHIDVNDPHAVANHLSALSSQEIDGVAIMAPESPQVRDAIYRLAERDIGVVQFLSGQPKISGMDFVGIDNHAAGATAANIMGRFLRVDAGTILVISESMQSRDSLERRLGFDEVMTDEFSNYDILPSLETYGNENRTNRIINRSLENNPDLCGVYIMNSEAELPISAIDKLTDTGKLVIVAHERTTFTESSLKSGQLDAIIDQHAGHSVRSAIRILRARSEQREPFASQETIRIEVLLKQNL